MNENIMMRRRGLDGCLHAGSSSAAFNRDALLDMAVHSIPLFNGEGEDNVWWRQAWKYTGRLHRSYCQLTND